MPIQIEDVPLQEINEIIRNQFSESLIRKNIAWRAASHLPTIRADRLAIIQFLQNCVDNAVKYGGEGLREVSIGYQDAYDAHILSVSDNGIGMQPDQAEKVFDLFSRQSTSNGIPGTGLGMAIVKKIAERHQGKIWLETEMGKGTAVFFKIPKL